MVLALKAMSIFHKWRYFAVVSKNKPDISLTMVCLVLQEICRPSFCLHLSTITIPNLEATSSPTQMKIDPSTSKIIV